jgi:hypothetical protein
VEDILPQRRLSLGEVGFRLLLGFEIDRRPVIGRAHSAGKESPVVAGIIPREAARVVAVVPEGDRELDRLDSLLAVERHSLAVCLNLLTAPRPQIRVPENGRVAESVAEGLPEWTALSLQLRASRAVLLPGFRKPTIVVTYLREP